jgi:energy-coupling factor transport system substrate-specific component
MNENKLKAKDLITIAIFTVISLLIYAAYSVIAGTLPLLYIFFVPVVVIPLGIPWCYLRAKTPRRFGTLIQCILFGLILFLITGAWFILAGAALGGVLAELASGFGKYKSFKLNVFGFALFGMAYNVSEFILFLVARDYYYNFALESGMNAEYMNAVLLIINWPMLLLTTALSAVGAAIGMLLGKKLLKKHFIKAGMV